MSKSIKPLLSRIESAYSGHSNPDSVHSALSQLADNMENKQVAASGDATGPSTTELNEARRRHGLPVK